jgi:cell division protein FtsI (penicillin-binding protein 3)
VAEHIDPSWRVTLKRRLSVAAAVFMLWSVAIEARLVYLQVFQHEWLGAIAEDQQLRQIELKPKRGDILDRNGRLFAYNVDAESVFAVPGAVDKPAWTVDQLCRALRVPTRTEGCTRKERELYISRLTKLDKHGKPLKFAWLSRWISPEQAARVRQLDLKGVSMRRETRRYYPNRELAAHVLGYVGDENTGLAGVEQKFDAVIGGQPGSTLVQVDAHGRPFSRLETPPTPGASIELTIDPYIQHIVERELAAAVEWSGADGGSAIVMDPFSGELFAMANVPTFNPNIFGDYPAEARKNRAIQDVYEPGSTFKVVTAGAALEEKIISPSDLIHTSPGVIRFGARVIDEAKGHNYGTLSFEDVIVKSSNVGAIKVGLKLGKERLSSYVTRFGFGAKSAPRDFRGESRGIISNVADLNDSAVASVSMGYQVSVTPLQMAAAFSAVANGGELVEPQLVRAIIHDGVRKPISRKVVRRVLSPGVATQLTAIMEGVVDRGTAKTAQVEGFTIAGKTGTAAKTIEGGRGYSNTDYNVSFAGFVPSRAPLFTILVVIDSPHKVSAYGGTVAGPVFQKIAAAVLRHRGVPPSLNPPPPVLIARDRSTRPQPVAGPADAPVVTVANTASDAPSAFPNLVGMNARDAIRTLVRLGLSPRVHGVGSVVNQQPAPGSSLDTIDAATLWLDRRPRLESSVGGASPRALDAAGVLRGRP